MKVDRTRLEAAQVVVGASGCFWDPSLGDTGKVVNVGAVSPGTTEVINLLEVG